MLGHRTHGCAFVGVSGAFVRWNNDVKRSVNLTFKVRLKVHGSSKVDL